MCLLVDKSVKPTKKIDKDGFLVGYKVLRKKNESPFFPQRYQNGWNFAFNEFGNPLYQQPSQSNYISSKETVIYRGFHIFLKRQDARDCIRTRVNKGTCKIIKIHYKPEDVINYGVFIDWFASTDYNREISSVKCVVVTKAFVRSFEKIR